MSGDLGARADQQDAAIDELRALLLNLAESVQIVAATVTALRDAVGNLDERVGEIEGL